MKLILIILLTMFSYTGCAFWGVGSNKESCDMPESKYKCATPSKILDATERDGFSSKNDDTHQIQNAPPPIFDSNVPVRNQPKVYTIHFFPWEDTDENLHWSSDVHTEIRKGKWNYGSREIKETNRYIPIQIDKRKKRKSEKKVSKNSYFPEMP